MNAEDDAIGWIDRTCRALDECDGGPKAKLFAACLSYADALGRELADGKTRRPERTLSTMAAILDGFSGECGEIGFEEAPYVMSVLEMAADDLRDAAKRLAGEERDDGSESEACS